MWTESVWRDESGRKEFPPPNPEGCGGFTIGAGVETWLRESVGIIDLRTESREGLTCARSTVADSKVNSVGRYNILRIISILLLGDTLTVQSHYQWRIPEYGYLMMDVHFLLLAQKENEPKEKGARRKWGGLRDVPSPVKRGDFNIRRLICTGGNS